MTKEELKSLKNGDVVYKSASFGSTYMCHGSVTQRELPIGSKGVVVDLTLSADAAWINWTGIPEPSSHRWSWSRYPVNMKEMERSKGRIASGKRTTLDVSNDGPVISSRYVQRYKPKPRPEVAVGEDPSEIFAIDMASRSYLDYPPGTEVIKARRWSSTKFTSDGSDPESASKHCPMGTKGVIKTSSYGSWDDRVRVDFGEGHATDWCISLTELDVVGKPKRHKKEVRGTDIGLKVTTISL